MIKNTVNRLIDWLYDPTRHVTVNTVSYIVFLSVHNHSISAFPTKQKNPNQSIKIKKKKKIEARQLQVWFDLRALIDEPYEDPSIRTVQITTMVHSST